MCYRHGKQDQEHYNEQEERARGEQGGASQGEGVVGGASSGSRGVSGARQGRGRE